MIAPWIVNYNLALLYFMYYRRNEVQKQKLTSKMSNQTRSIFLHSVENNVYYD